MAHWAADAVWGRDLGAVGVASSKAWSKAKAPGSYNQTTCVSLNLDSIARCQGIRDLLVQEEKKGLLFSE
jgi:hypothetical protein